MKKNNYIIFFLLIIFIFSSFCRKNEIYTEPDTNAIIINLVYVEWESEIVSTNILKAVIEEKLGYRCHITPVPLTSLYESIATGDKDATVSAWLPSLHHNYIKEYKDRLINLGVNMQGTRIGLVVPDFVDISSIEELIDHAEKFNNKIIGIDIDAGLMNITRKAIENYDLNEFKLVSGSDTTMTSALENAIRDKKWVVVTGWTPHWKFGKWDLKYLKDDKNIFGKEENINTIVRIGLKDDIPEIYNFLKNFSWTAEEMQNCLLFIKDQDLTVYESAKIWVKENEDIVKRWIE